MGLCISLNRPIIERKNYWHVYSLKISPIMKRFKRYSKYYSTKYYDHEATLKKNGLDPKEWDYAEESRYVILNENVYVLITLQNIHTGKIKIIKKSTQVYRKETFEGVAVIELNGTNFSDVNVNMNRFYKEEKGDDNEYFYFEKEEILELYKKYVFDKDFCKWLLKYMLPREADDFIVIN